MDDGKRQSLLRLLDTLKNLFKQGLQDPLPRGSFFAPCLIFKPQRYEGKIMLKVLPFPGWLST
jgi:hypothetical protein